MKNPTPDPRDRLWLDLAVADHSPPGGNNFEQVIARRVRRRRALRRTAVVAACALVPALALLLPFHDDARRNTAHAERPGTPSEDASPHPQGVERITDEELLTLLPDTPLLILNDADEGRRIILLADHAYRTPATPWDAPP
jgi:hypothetical protein